MMRPPSLRTAVWIGLIVLVIYFIIWVPKDRPGHPNPRHRKVRIIPPRISRTKPAGKQHTNASSPDGSIPHMIHQIWKTAYVHRSMTDWIQSWAKRNSNWTHVLWTHQMAHALVSSEFPDFMSIYNNYSGDIYRADVARHFILHKFGGVYADLDMECLRPLDDLVDHHQCLVGQEPESHASLLYKRSKTFVSNAFIACRKGHPFLKTVIDHLPENARHSNLMSATGPFMVDTISQAYLASRSGLAPDLFVAPAPYFQPSFDEHNRQSFVKTCAVLLSPPGRISPEITKDALQYETSVIQKQVEDCRRLAADNFTNVTPDAHAYSNHHWVHTYWYPGKYNGKTTDSNVHFRDIVPGVVMGDELMKNTVAT